MPHALITLVLCGLLLVTLPPTAHAQKGKNAFAPVFKEDAVGRHDGNAYLLTYLVTLVFPEGLDQLAGPRGRAEEKSFVRELHTNPDRFLVEYRRLTEFLFYDAALPVSATNPRPQFAFIQASDGRGYDPEAMVISTPKAVIVVMRGTDRDAAARGEFGYGTAEWLRSDFAPLGIDPDVRGIPGKVHEGFWKSLMAPTKFWGRLQPTDTVPRKNAIGAAPQNQFREKVYQQIRDFGGATKKLWIVGHSLGAAHAQVLAMWLDARVDTSGTRQGFRAQGVYAVAAPHVGNKEFAANLTARFPGGRLQRFDFLDDPITVLPPYVIGYQRAGTRVYYDDIKTIKFAASERFITDDDKVIHGIGGTLANASVSWMTEGNKFIKFRAASSLFCFHHPQWYLNAAYAQLNRVEKARVPNPLRVPDIGDFYSPCGPLDVARGRRNPVAAAAEAAAEAADAVKDAVETVAYNAGQLLANATGAALPEGTYLIRCVKGGKLLDVSGSCVNNNGCKLQLWDLGKSASNNKFVVKKQGLGYTMKNGSRFVEVDGDDLFDNGAQIQVWEANLPFGGHAPNQVWHFHKIPNKSNRYLIVNEATGKVIDATDNCTGQNGCRVKQWSGVSNDPSQVWIVEKAN